MPMLEAHCRRKCTSFQTRKAVMDQFDVTQMTESVPETRLVELARRAAATSDALRALSHEHRLMILSLLNGRERSVGEIESILKLPQPAVSQQLARLRLDSLVVSRRDGRTIYYTTDTGRVEAIWRDLGLMIGTLGDAATAVAEIDAEIAEALEAMRRAVTEVATVGTPPPVAPSDRTAGAVLETNRGDDLPRRPALVDRVSVPAAEMVSAA
jgi:DNA-binding transcriptional ArsR family regulator